MDLIIQYCSWYFTEDFFNHCSNVNAVQQYRMYWEYILNIQNNFDKFPSNSATRKDEVVFY